MSRPFASRKNALGICDRCGLSYKLKQLKMEFVNLNKSNLMVCPECWDPDHPQNWLGRIDYDDPQALQNPRIDTGVVDGNYGNAIRFEFKTDTESFTATNSTLTFVTGGTVVNTATGSDPQIALASGVDAVASTYINIRARVKRLVAGTWSGQFFWQRTITDSTYTQGRSLRVSEPDWIGMGDPYRDLLWEMEGVTDWDGTIEKIRFDFFSDNLSSIEIDWIRLESKNG